MFTAGMVMLFSALMVFFRDIEFLLGVVLTGLVLPDADRLRVRERPERPRAASALNPMLPFVNAYRDVLYDGDVPAALPAGRVRADRHRHARRLLRAPSTA